MQHPEQATSQKDLAPRIATGMLSLNISASVAVGHFQLDKLCDLETETQKIESLAQFFGMSDLTALTIAECEKFIDHRKGYLAGRKEYWNMRRRGRRNDTATDTAIVLVTARMNELKKDQEITRSRVLDGRLQSVGKDVFPRDLNLKDLSFFKSRGEVKGVIDMREKELNYPIQQMFPETVIGVDQKKAYDDLAKDNRKIIALLEKRMGELRLIESLNLQLESLNLLLDKPDLKVDDFVFIDKSAGDQDIIDPNKEYAANSILPIIVKATDVSEQKWIIEALGELRIEALQQAIKKYSDADDALVPSCPTKTYEEEITRQKAILQVLSVWKDTLNLN